MHVTTWIVLFQEAMVCAAAALRLYPDLGRAHYELAACHEANGNLEASLRNVELAKRWGLSCLLCTNTTRDSPLQHIYCILLREP